ncbi:YciI family protein [Chitinivorax sp. B]|uniref:YciI family protein n=1 Tax=Chitinivorax sp. B TaxID=2502235 RepID=UPI0010F51683|nr:YciI family protein [Chitinivorax sp. B]
MFVVTLTYLRPIEAVDATLPGHVQYLQRQFADGVFLASGRRVPRTGGVILARADSLTALQAVLADDPFHQLGIARYDVIEFTPTMTAPGLDLLKET